jgi:regulation of enolase protein 1 (concanavalin A-like superfamily)
MKKSSLQFLITSFLIFTSVACGPSKAELDSTATQAAVSLSGTQTAQAPTATATFTPSPTATYTPTVTPTPTDTPTSTPTPLPQWMSAGLVLEDLPSGFVQMSDVQMSALNQNLPPNSIAFGFMNEADQQAVMGYYISYPSQAEQDAFDASLPDLLQLFTIAYGATTEPETIKGLDDLGDSRAASTFVSEAGETDLRWENILFRRGEVGALLFVFYAEGKESLISSGDIARLLDQRLAQTLSIGDLVSASSNRDDFDAGLLEPWEWINEKSEKWNLTERPGYLRIYASHEKGVNVLLRPVSQGDFTIETRVIFEPNTNFQFAGLTVYQDENNSLAFGRAFCDTANTCVGNGIYFDNVLDGNWTGINFGTQFDSKSEAYLRLERRGDNVIAFYSPDGKTWSKIGMHQVPAGYQVNGVGLIAMNDFNTADADIPADFDYFELSEYK